MAYRQTPERLARDQAQRLHILQLAHTQVVEGGFAQLTMQRLAKAADIATGTLYRHFSGKGELAAEVFCMASQREVDALQEVFAAQGSAVQRLRQGVERFAARAWDSRQLAWALIAEPVDPQVEEQRLRYREAYAELFAQVLREGCAAGEFSVQYPHLVAACFVGAISEVLVGPLSPQARAQRSEHEVDDDLKRVRATLVELFLGALGAREHA